MRRLWIISHFDRHGLAAEYVLAKLRAYRALGGEVLVVSTAALTPSARSRLAGAADELIERENVGLDFASWRHGLSLRNWAQDYDEVIVANDSVYGPFANIAPILQRLSDPQTPILGLTITREYFDHIQSFWVGFNLRVFPPDLFASFWQAVDTLSDKNEIITRYEIGLSHFVRQAGLPLAAVLDMRAPRPPIWLKAAPSQMQPERWSDVLALRRIWGAQIRRRSNPMMAHWREVMLAGVPFVKVELMRDNPVGVSRAAVMRAVAAYGDGHADAIRSHLRSMRLAQSSVA